MIISWKHVYSCAFMFKIYMKAQNMHVFMYFFDFVTPFTHHFIIMVKDISEYCHPDMQSLH